MMLSRSAFISSCLGVAATAAAEAAPELCPNYAPPALSGIPAHDWNELAGPKALVLVGGVARGAYQAGAVQALHTLGYHFDLVCGTSIGAINGALVAQGDYDRLGDVWLNIAAYNITKVKKVYAPITEPFARRKEPDAGLFNKTTAGAYTYMAFGAIDSAFSGGLNQIAAFDRGPSDKVVSEKVELARVRLPFAYVATNASLERPEAFYVEPAISPPGIFNVADAVVRLTRFAAQVDMPLHTIDAKAADSYSKELYWKSVRASGAFPLAFDPVPIGFKTRKSGSDKTYLFVDGGITANTPISLASELGAQNVLTVFVDPKEASSEKDFKTFDLKALANSMINTLQNRQITKDEYFISRLYPDLRFYELRPQKALQVGVFGFDDQPNIDGAYCQGFQDAVGGPKRVTNL